MNEEFINNNKRVSDLILSTKYLQKGETPEEGRERLARTLSDSKEHERHFLDILNDQRFLPAGRIQNAIGASRITTAFNCFVSGEIMDSMESIMDRLKEAAETMRRGGGIGFDFSNLRPKNDRIISLDSTASGPISFAKIYDQMCNTIASSGHRRGAMMLVLRVDHPDIREFIHAKRDNHTLTSFNISVGITDEFMECVERGQPFDLVFNGRVYETVDAKALWNEIMRNNWDWAEPGVLFLDTINRKNNLYYCETISATNPCGEQPLPPYGACLLGSLNLVKFVFESHRDLITNKPVRKFDFEKFMHDIPAIVRAMDNIIDKTIYPLKEQEKEAKSKRRMGLGITGLANASEMLGLPYGSKEMLSFTEAVLEVLRDCAYQASVGLAIEKGRFPMFSAKDYCKGEFIETLPDYIQNLIKKYGIRNSHLLSIAPTGTISLSAGNISSGIEPPYVTGPYERKIFVPSGVTETFKLMDYAEANFGVKGKSAEDVPASAHVDVLCVASRMVDSSVSKTCNVGDDVTFKEFKELYMKAYKGGASGCTTFRISGKRFSIMKKEEAPEPEAPLACFIDPETGERTCD